MLLGAIEAGGTKFVCATGAENGQVSDRISIPTTTPAETMTAVDDYFTTHPLTRLVSVHLAPSALIPMIRNMVTLPRLPNPAGVTSIF